jgi:UDP-GlcNAc:undecaprenyl-phosphate GlcNAc-1-phosphate transferase
MEQVSGYINQFFGRADIQPYLQILPYALVTFVAAFLLTPIIGNLAKRFGFIDLPVQQRKRTDKTIKQRIHTSVKPRLGGLAVLFPFIIITLLSVQVNPRVAGILLGLIILIVSGAIDDRFELSAPRQFLLQVLASAIVVFFGVSIAQIDVFGISLNFNWFSHAFVFGHFVYTFVFPADIITILWIMLITNAINWMSGIDAVGEMITIIGSITTTLLAVRFGLYDIAVISAILASGVLGFLPYNYPPSKIFSGTSGNTGYGYLLAVLSILSGGKVVSAIILLSLPLVDMIWVIINRINEHKDVPLLRRPFISGKVHLHHRLMDLGFTPKQTMYIEASLMAVVSVIAISFAGFSNSLMAASIVIAALVIIFTVITILQRASKRKKVEMEEKKRTEPPPEGPTPEERFAY